MTVRQSTSNLWYHEKTPTKSIKTKYFDEDKILKELASIAKEEDPENDYGAKYVGNGIFKVKLIDCHIGRELLHAYQKAGYKLVGVCSLTGKYGYNLEINLEWDSEEEENV